MTSPLVTQFTEKFRSLKGEVHTAANEEDAAETIMRICGELSAEVAAVSDMPPELLSAVRTRAEAAGVRTLGPRYESSGLPGAIDTADVGVTVAKFAIAETGTLVEIADNDAERLVSSLPDTHICVVSARTFLDQLSDAAVPIREAFAKHSANCVVSFISGPSRTGDIELRLTLGVHGPRAAHAIVVDDLPGAR